MSEPRKTAGPQDAPPQTAAGPQVVTTALKWVGGVTAVLSLVFGLNQLVGLVSSHRQRDLKVKELLKTSEMQEQARDYAAAWSGVEEADRLTQGGREVRAAQESLAMVWLENASVLDQQKFSDIVGKLTPVLDRAASTAQGERKADLLAHLGWAEFLRSRDGFAGLVPDDFYRQALKIDPQNPYAHAMLGHWDLWNGGRVGEARDQFALALASGREHDYVRRLQLAGLEGLHSVEGEVELIRVINDMRKNGEQVDSGTRDAVWFLYDSDLDPESIRRQPLLAALPPAEQLATFTWLFDNADFDPSRAWIRDFYRAILQEEAGQRTEALQTLRSVRSRLPYAAVPRIRNEVEKGIARLSKAGAR